MSISPFRIQEVYSPSGYTGRFVVFSVITNIYNKKTKGTNLMGLFITTGKFKKGVFDN
jgi:hypothetical protein